MNFVGIDLHKKTISVASSTKGGNWPGRHWTA